MAQESNLFKISRQPSCIFALISDTKGAKIISTLSGGTLTESDSKYVDKNNWYENYGLVQLKHVEPTAYGFEQVSFIKDLSACINTNLNISNINESLTFITCINIIQDNTLEIPITHANRKNTFFMQGTSHLSATIDLGYYSDISSSKLYFSMNNQTISAGIPSSALNQYILIAGNIDAITNTLNLNALYYDNENSNEIVLSSASAVILATDIIDSNNTLFIGDSSTENITEQLYGLYGVDINYIGIFNKSFTSDELKSIFNNLSANKAIVKQKLQPLYTSTLTIKTSTNNENIILSKLSASVQNTENLHMNDDTIDKLIINWGDGNISGTTLQDNIQHKYLSSSTYTINIFNNKNTQTNRIGIAQNTSALISVDRLSQTLTSCYQAFQDSQKLSSILPGQSIPDGVIDCKQMFKNCISLSTVSPIFTENSSCKSTYKMFDSCSGVEYINNDFILPYKNLYEAQSMFDTCNIIAIPSSLTLNSQYQISEMENSINYSGMFKNCKSLTGVPSTLFDLNIENKSPYNCSGLFINCYELTTFQNGFSIPGNVIDTQAMLQNTKITKIPSTLFDTQYISSLTIDCTNMFKSCNNTVSGVINIQSGFAIPPNVVSMDGMFEQSGVDKIPSSLFNQTILDNINNRTCIEMFYNCDKLTTIYDGLTIPKNITNTASMFKNCSVLLSIPSTMFNGCSSLLYAQNMFENCTLLSSDISTQHIILPSGILCASGMFKNCTNLQSLDCIYFPYGTYNTSEMFLNCSTIKYINKVYFNNYNFGQRSILTYNQTSINYSNMFKNCGGLSSINDFSWNPTKHVNTTSMFEKCTSLENINNFKLPSYGNCYSMFQDCENFSMNISSIIPDITTFDSNLTRCFYNCLQLSGYAQPSVFWQNPNIHISTDNNQTDPNINNCFANCSSLVNYTEIPCTWGGLKPEISGPSAVTIDISTTYSYNLDVLYNQSLGQTISGVQNYSDTTQLKVDITTVENYQPSYDQLQITVLPNNTLQNKDYLIDLKIYVYDKNKQIFSCTDYKLLITITGSTYIKPINVLSFELTPPTDAYSYDENLNESICEYELSVTLKDNLVSGYILWGDQEEGVQPQAFINNVDFKSAVLTHIYKQTYDKSIYNIKVSGQILSLDLTNGFSDNNYSQWITSVSSLPCTLERAQNLFKDCRNLSTLNKDTFILPSGLIDCQVMFENCTSLASDISNIFNLWNNTTIDNIETRKIGGMFYNCSSIYGTLPAQYLWNAPPNTFDIRYGQSGYRVFEECISLTNYNEIPYEWGGPVEQIDPIM